MLLLNVVFRETAPPLKSQIEQTQRLSTKMRFFFGAFILLTTVVRATQADAGVNLTKTTVGFPLTESSLFEQDDLTWNSDSLIGFGLPELEDSGLNDSDRDVGLEKFTLEFNRAKSPASFSFTKLLYIFFMAMFVALSVLTAAVINFASYNLCRTGNRSGRSPEPSQAFTNADAIEIDSNEAVPATAIV